MDEDTYPPIKERGKILGFEMTIYHISEAIGSLWHLYTELGVEEKELITIRFTYTDVNNRRLAVINPGRIGFTQRQECRSQEIVIEKTLPLQLWRSSEVDQATSIICEIFEHFQWLDPNKSEIQKLASNLLSKRI